MSRSAPRPVSHTARETVHEYLTVRRVQDRPDLVRILPIGEIDLVTAPTLHEALTAAESQGVANVVVDLTEVRFLALIGARVLNKAAERSTDSGRRVALVAPNPMVKRVLDLTGAQPTYGTVANALSALDPV